jgi:hypothetical protein
MTCTHCNDTGSLTKELWGDLNCAYCSSAVERAALGDWLKQRQRADDIGHVDYIDAWTIYQHGKAAAASQNQ